MHGYGCVPGHKLERAIHRRMVYFVQATHHLFQMAVTQQIPPYAQQDDKKWRHLNGCLGFIKGDSVGYRCSTLRNIKASQSFAMEPLETAVRLLLTRSFEQFHPAQSHPGQWRQWWRLFRQFYGPVPIFFLPSNPRTPDWCWYRRHGEPFRYGKDEDKVNLLFWVLNSTRSIRVAVGHSPEPADLGAWWHSESSPCMCYFHSFFKVNCDPWSQHFVERQWAARCRVLTLQWKIPAWWRLANPASRLHTVLLARTATNATGTNYHAVALLRGMPPAKIHDPTRCMEPEKIARARLAMRC